MIMRLSLKEEELFKFNTESAVVKAAVIVSVFHSEFGIVGSDEPPDFTADGTSFGTLEKFIVPCTINRT